VGQVRGAGRLGRPVVRDRGVRRFLLLVVAVAASVAAWTGPLILAQARGDWWWLGLCAVTVPICEACWAAHDIDGRNDE
jgi:hypothetical protein